MTAASDTRGSHMQLEQTDEWVIDAPLPKHDDRQPFEVWLGGQNVRTVRRVGNEPETIFAPGTLIFTDCTNPMQNAVCPEASIQGWRFKK